MLRSRCQGRSLLHAHRGSCDCLLAAATAAAHAVLLSATVIHAAASAGQDGCQLLLYQVIIAPVTARH